MKKMNQKVLLTMELVENAAIQLEKTKDRKDITVLELCKEAGINRTTFYSHYQSVEEVFESIYAKIQKEIENHLQHLNINGKLKRNYMEYLTYIKEQSTLFSSLIRSNPFATDDEGKLKETIIKHIMSTIPDKISEMDKRMIANYLFGGTLSCMITWYEHPDSYSIPEFTDLMLKITYPLIGGKAHE